MMNQQMSQKQLLQWINMVSFAVNDITLYLIRILTTKKH